MRAFARVRLLSAGLVFPLMSVAVAVLPPLPGSAAEPGETPVAPISTSPIATQKPSMPKWTGSSVAWPAGGSGETVVGGALARLGGPVPVGGLRVSVTPAASGAETAGAQPVSDASGKVVEVSVLPQTSSAATGARGVIFSAGAVESLGGPVNLSVSYADFGHAFGGNWAGRLHLVTMPSCAMSTPSLSAMPSAD